MRIISLLEDYPDDWENGRRMRTFTKPPFKQFPRALFDDLESARANWFDNANEKQKEDSHSVREVSIGELETYQYAVDRRRVDSFKIKDPGGDIWVDEFRGHLLISDGHHRLAARLANGVTTATVIVRSLTGWDRPGYH